MAEEAGGVSYNVDVDLSQLMALESAVDKTTKDITKKFDQADKALAEFEKSEASAAAASANLKKSVDALGVGLNQLSVTGKAAAIESSVLNAQMNAIAESSARAQQAANGITNALQKQRDGVAQFIAKLKEENDTLGLNAAELNQYRAAKLGASEKDQQIIANITSQIEAYKRNEAAIEANAQALTAANQKKEAARQSLDTLIQSLQFQAATLGKSTREIILYRAAQEGATAADKKAIIQSLNAIETYERKAAATRKVQFEMNKTAQAVGVASGSFGNLRGVAGNLGFQLQDIAVQAQAGTSAFVILGQQGSQLASAFGPTGAVIGAVIAVSAAIGGVLFTSLSKTTEEIRDEFLPTVEDMREKLDELSKSQAELAIIQVKKELEPLGGIARTAGARIEYLKKQIEKYPSNKDVTQWNEELTEQEALLDGVNQKIIKLNEDQTAFNGIIKRNIEGTQGQQKAEAERLTSLQQLIAAVQSQAAVAGLTERGIALYTAEQLKATESDIRSINVAYDIIEAEKAKQEAIKKSTEEKKAYLKSVEDAFIAELKAEQDQRRTVTTEFQQVQTGITSDLESPAQKADRELSERLAVIRNYAQQEYADKEAALQAQLDAEQAYSERIKAIRDEDAKNRSTMNMGTLSATADFFGNLASIAEQGGKDQFSTWKALASAQAAISATMAVLNVLANPSIPYPLNIGLAGSMAALAGAQVAQIQGAQYSGSGRLYGGPVSGGKLYPFMEDGKPEALQMGGKTYLWTGGGNGNVVSNKDMASGGGAIVNVNITTPAGMGAEVTQRQNGNMTDIDARIYELAPKVVAGNINERGVVHRSITQATTAGNRT